MRLYLIRHGETVDNIAQLFAGSLDSLLTNHGVQQASRLGAFFRDAHIVFTHIFSSHLTRAAKTASVISEHQPTNGKGKPLEVVKTPLIQEQDFGSYEGKSYADPLFASALFHKDEYRRLHSHEPTFVEMESNESVDHRVDKFLDEYLLPVLHESAGNGDDKPTVAVVSHGITLAHIWRRLLARLPRRSVIVHRDVFSEHGTVDLERIGGWSNTGFLAVEFHKVDSGSASSKASEASALSDADPVLVDAVGLDAEVQNPASPEAQAGKIVDTVSSIDAIAAGPKLLNGWTTTVNTINGTLHLNGLKRAPGGIGSAAHDEKQQSLDAFFKKKML